MTDWAQDLLRSCCARVADIEDIVGERFPLHAEDGRWTTTARGSWAGGFWVGLLALRGAFTGEGDPQAMRRRLDAWVDADTVCRGLIFWYGSVGERLGLHPPLTSTSVAAQRLAKGFDEDLGAIAWGSALAPDGPPVRPDGAAGVVPLLLAHGYDDLARRHLDTHLSLPAPKWRRGAAWLLLATMDGHCAMGGYGHRIETMAREWSSESGMDNSASAIAAVALLKSGDGRMRARGARLLRASATGTAEYNGRCGLRVVWGDFFTMLGAALLTGVIESHQC